MYDELESQVDALMGAYQGREPGAVVAVLRHGAAVMMRCYGLADLEAATAATAATNYRLASMSKQFTAAAVLLLAEQGLLGIDDPVRRWLPELARCADAMTVRHFLIHASGVADFEDLIAGDRIEPVHDADVLHLLAAADRRYFQPGTGYRYSNSGYALLSLIVSRAADEDYAAFLRRRIFGPLGMRGTVAFEDGRATVANRAYGYSTAPGGWIRTDQSLTSATLGDGGIYSSIDDLARWDAALQDERLLSAASLRQAFTPSSATGDPSVHYGFGWRITGGSVWHSGESIGFRHVFLRFLAPALSVIVLSNRNAPTPYPAAISIAALFWPEADSQRAAWVESGPNPEAKLLPPANC